MGSCRETAFLIACVIIAGVLLSSSCNSQTENTDKNHAHAVRQRMYRMHLGDTTVPSISAFSVYEIVRGCPENKGIGRIFLRISATDDMTPVGSCEYRLVVVGGQLPKGFISPTEPMYSRDYFAEGQQLELLILKWDDGRKRIQDPFDFQMVLYAVDRGGNASPSSDTIRVAHSGRYIDILFDFGVLARNRLDTARGVFVKDMVADPPLTLDLTLTKKEREQVLSRAKEIGFFDMPRVAIPENSVSRMSPCSSYYLEIRAGNRRHSVSWDNCARWKNDQVMDSLREISRMIQDMIMSKEAYKRSPEPTSGYL